MDRNDLINRLSEFNYAKFFSLFTSLVVEGTICRSQMLIDSWRQQSAARRCSPICGGNNLPFVDASRFVTGTIYRSQMLPDSWRERSTFCSGHKSRRLKQHSFFIIIRTRTMAYPSFREISGYESSSIFKIGALAFSMVSASSLISGRSCFSAMYNF